MKGRLPVPVLLLLLLTIGCGEQGATRASAKELVGSYETQFQYGKERLTLNPDMTFLQIFFSSHGEIATKGTWQKSNQFLGPTEVLLVGNYVSEKDPGSPSVYGQRNLVVHKERGKLKLALNEAADWYYDRVQ
jgi:hypothetical protein